MLDRPGWPIVRPVPSPREVVGIPALPPPRLGSWVLHLRAALDRLHRAMAPPPVRILEGLFGLLDAGALVALHELRVADGLTGRTTLEDLARRLDVDAAALDRLVRYGAARGWLRIDRRGRLAPNAVTRFLRTGHPGGWAAWVELAGGRDVFAAVLALGESARTGRDAFVAANGATFFEWMWAHPDRRRVFDAAMAAGGRLHGLALADALDWSEHRRVCDVGGGDGSTLRTLLARHRHLEGVLLDLPDVTAPAPAASRLDVRAGDAFVQLPNDCDAYLYVNVVHDWGDDDAVRLLARAAIDAPPGASIVVVEGHRALRPVDGITTSTDLLMLALAPGGRERTEHEIGALGLRAGLVLRRTVALASADFAHVFTC
jgi:O-methyltransferase domain